MWNYTQRFRNTQYRNIHYTTLDADRIFIISFLDFDRIFTVILLLFVPLTDRKNQKDVTLFLWCGHALIFLRLYLCITIAVWNEINFYLNCLSIRRIWVASFANTLRFRTKQQNLLLVFFPKELSKMNINYEKC